MFVEANRDGAAVERVSPSGRYRLLVRDYRTGVPGWNYSRGTVFRVADGATVCDIQRDYGVFHHSWVTKDGREWLISGRSYVSQTIVDLDREVEYDRAPSSDDFCWARCELSPDGRTLLVDGCYWACPYEIRFFDFTEPAGGWPSLPIVGSERLEEPSDKELPRWLDSETVDCFFFDQASVPNERVRLRRSGGEMRIMERWVSDAESARRGAEARAQAEQDAWWVEFSASDPMYLRLVGLLREHGVTDALHIRGERGVGCYFRQTGGLADLRWDVAAKRLELAVGRDEIVAFDYAVAGIETLVAEVLRRRDER